MGKRIYISGQITDNPTFKTDFRDAEAALWNKYINDGWEYSEIINPVKVSYTLPSSFTHDDYMTVDMILLSKCDAIFMLKGYEKSAGALAELLLAKSMGLEIFYEGDLACELYIESENSEE